MGFPVLEDAGEIWELALALEKDNSELTQSRPGPDPVISWNFLPANGWLRQYSAGLKLKRQALEADGVRAGGPHAGI